MMTFKQHARRLSDIGLTYVLSDAQKHIKIDSGTDPDAAVRSIYAAAGVWCEVIFTIKGGWLSHPANAILEEKRKKSYGHWWVITAQEIKAVLEKLKKDDIDFRYKTLVGMSNESKKNDEIENKIARISYGEKFNLSTKEKEKIRKILLSRMINTLGGLSKTAIRFDTVPTTVMGWKTRGHISPRAECKIANDRELSTLFPYGILRIGIDN